MTRQVSIWERRKHLLPCEKSSTRLIGILAFVAFRFLRKFKSIRKENPNVNVGLFAMECELQLVSIHLSLSA